MKANGEQAKPMTTLLVNGGVPAKRGVYAAFRRYLNDRLTSASKYRNKAGALLYEQRTRGYGDYLFHQDRPKFEFELERALLGLDFEDFGRARWLL